MRTVLFALLAFVAVFPAAADESARAIVFKKECDQVDPKKTGFECRFNQEGMQLYWREKTDAMSPQRREKAKAEFSRVALRYIDLGGQHFTVRFAHWAPNQVRNCWRRKNVRYADYYCVDN